MVIPPFSSFRKRVVVQSIGYLNNKLELIIQYIAFIRYAEVQLRVPPLLSWSLISDTVLNEGPAAMQRDNANYGRSSASLSVIY